MIRFVWFSLFVLASASAETIYLRPSADTALLEAFPTNNFGGQRWLNAGTTQNFTKNRGLMRFDVAAALPPGAHILSASLMVEAVGQPIDGYAIQNFRLHRVLKDWGEGNKSGAPPTLGAPAGTNECNWTHRFAFTDETWAVPGGSNGVDYASEYSVDTFVYDTFASPYTFGPAAGMTADLQQWLDYPETNFGWMLLAEHEHIDFTARRFASREDAAFGPVLTIDFVVPPTINVSLSGGEIVLSFMNEPDQGYTVEYCPSLSCNPWAVLTNLAPEDITGPRVVSDSVEHPQRYYRIRLAD